MTLEFHNHFIDKLAFFNGLLSGVALYPQVWSLLVYGPTGGVSLTSFIIILVNSSVWLAYAVHRSLISLAIASALNIVASGILVGAIMFVR